MYHSKYKKYKERYLSLVQQQREQQLGGHVNDQQLEKYYKYKAKKYRKKYKDLVGGGEAAVKYHKPDGRWGVASSSTTATSAPTTSSAGGFFASPQITISYDEGTISLKKGSYIQFEISLELDTINDSGHVVASSPFTIKGKVETILHNPIVGPNKQMTVNGIRVKVNKKERVNKKWLEAVGVPGDSPDYVEIGFNKARGISMAGNTPSWKTIKVLRR